MKIIIPGSKGFIGGHALNYFTTQGHEVYGADVVVDYITPNYFLIDSTNHDFKEAFEREKFDVCINCAGAASVGGSFAQPLRDFQLNAAVVYKILDAIRNLQPECKFINLSSAAVYGNPKVLPVAESSNTDHPLSPYGHHKRYAEKICSEFNMFFGLNTASLRIFSAYGPHLRKQLFWDIYTKSKSGKVKMFGTGDETRDFIYVEDIMRAIDLYIQRGKFDGDCMNVANGEDITIRSATSKMLEFLEFEGEAEFDGTVREGDPKNWKADISKLSQIGYERTYSFDNGLKMVAEWMKNIS